MRRLCNMQNEYACQGRLQADSCRRDVIQAKQKQIADEMAIALMEGEDSVTLDQGHTSDCFREDGATVPTEEALGCRRHKRSPLG